MSLHVIIISCVTEKQHPTTLWWMIKSQVVLKALKYMFWSIVCPLVHQFFFPTSRKQASPASGHVPLVSRVSVYGRFDCTRFNLHFSWEVHVFWINNRTLFLNSDYSNSTRLWRIMLIKEVLEALTKTKQKKTSIQGCVIAEHGNPWSGAQVLLLGK